MHLSSTGNFLFASLILTSSRQSCFSTLINDIINSRKQICQEKNFTNYLKCNSSARAIRKAHLRCFTAATQLTLLIIGRSVHSINNELIHASMIRSLFILWLNCYFKIKIDKIAKRYKIGDCVDF